MRDDLLGAAAIAAHIGECSPSLIPDLMANGWPIVKVGRQYRSTKSAIDLYLQRHLHRRQPENTEQPNAQFILQSNARFILQLEEIRDGIERMLRDAVGAQPAKEG